MRVLELFAHTFEVYTCNELLDGKYIDVDFKE